MEYNNSAMEYLLPKYVLSFFTLNDLQTFATINQKSEEYSIKTPINDNRYTNLSYYTKYHKNCNQLIATIDKNEVEELNEYLRNNTEIICLVVNTNDEIDDCIDVKDCVNLEILETTLLLRGIETNNHEIDLKKKKKLRGISLKIKNNNFRLKLPESVENITTTCPIVEGFFSKVKSFNAEDVFFPVNFLQWFPNLEVLHFENVHTNILYWPNSIKVINLNNCEMIDNITCNKVECLSILRKTRINDETINNLKTLRVLALTLNQHLTPHCFQDLKLYSIIVLECRHIKPEDIPEILLVCNDRGMEIN